MVQTPKPDPALAEKKRHLLRRFGFGASLADQAKLAPLTLDAAIAKCLSCKGPDAVSPFSFFWRDKEEADPGTYRLRAYWVAEMCHSATPLREKLALFWHSHFAVSDGKVEHGPMMLDYIQTLRKEPDGKFRDIMGRVVKTPAFLRMLDVYRLRKGHPNENFGRELLELYTLGIGNYTEPDIREIARAFTGWSYEDLFWGLADTNDKRLQSMMKDGVSCASFAYMPGFHDSTEKTVLGKRGRLDGEAVLDILAMHPLTAKRLCEKLWTVFASEAAPPAAIDKLSKRYLATGGSIREVLLEMTRCPEFWAKETVGGKIKSPVEYVVGYVRALEMEKPLEDKLKVAPDQRIDAFAFDRYAALAWHMDVMGQSLCWPPSVAGWDEGAAWVNTNTMMRRKGFGGLDNWVKTTPDGKEVWIPGPGPRWAARQVVARGAKDTPTFVSALCEIMDCRLGKEGRAAIEERFTKDGGPGAFADQNRLAAVILNSLSLMRAAPEMQVC